MENATKGLLIAIAVLIAIILIATGVLMIKNISGTSKNADKVGNSLSLATDEAIRDYQKTYVTKEEFNKFISYFDREFGDRHANEFINIIKNEQNAKIRNQIQLIAYLYTGTEYNFNTIPTRTLKNSKSFLTRDEYFKYMIETGFNTLKSNNLIETVPAGLESYKYYFIKVYALKSGYENYDGLDEHIKQKIENDYSRDKQNKLISGHASFFWDYDKDGYIDKMYYIIYLDFKSSWNSKRDL